MSTTNKDENGVKEQIFVKENLVAEWNLYRCSNCKEHLMSYYEGIAGRIMKRPKYCPNCGARMVNSNLY